MTRVLFVRHGATDLAGRFCGHTDPGLNADGKRHAWSAAKQVESADVRAIYASDLLRARETADAVAAQAHVPLIVSPALREIAFGAWEGLSWQEIEQQDPFEAAQWLAQFPHRAAPQGEAFSCFRKRVLAELDRICRERSGPVCVVTHGGVIRVALMEMHGNCEGVGWPAIPDYGEVLDLLMDSNAGLQKGSSDEYRNQAR
jgi:broad specificity phosphatase PhoE